MEICALLTHARVCQPWVKISGVRAPELAAHFPAGPFDPAGCVKRAAYPAASWAKCGAPTQSLYSPSARRPMWAWPLQTSHAARLGDLLDLLGCVVAARPRRGVVLARSRRAWSHTAGPPTVVRTSPVHPLAEHPAELRPMGAARFGEPQGQAHSHP